MKNWGDSLISYLFMPPWNRLDLFLKRECRGFHSLIDLGCGANSLVSRVEGIKYKVGVDVYLPSILQSGRNNIHDRYICSDLRTLELRAKSFDIVVGIDILEHFEKSDSIKVLENAERIAKGRVFFFTPNGFVDTDIPEVHERYGHNPWRIHHCGWTVEEFLERGYRCYGLNGLKSMRYGESQMRLRPKKLFQVLSNLTQLLTYRYPKMAYQLVAIKDMTTPV